MWHSPELAGRPYNWMSIQMIGGKTKLNFPEHRNVMEFLASLGIRIATPAEER
jgi:hypothetical protein